jgi:hypothetical protein
MLWLRRSYSRIEMIVDTMRPEEGLEPFLSERFFQTSLRLSAPSTRRLEEAVKSLDQSSQFFLTNYGSGSVATFVLYVCVVYMFGTNIYISCCDAMLSCKISCRAILDDNTTIP